MKVLVPSLLFLAVVASVNAQAATPANTLVIAQSIDDVVSFDPARGFELTTVQSFNSLYQRLIQSDPHNPIDLKPTLASSWQAGADNRSLTFSLRPDAKFASGNPLRPEDVIFSLSRVVKLNLEPSFILTQLGWNAKNVEQHLSKVDDHRVKISWSENVSPAFVLSLLSAPVSSIVDAKEALAHQQGDDLGHQWLNSHRRQRPLQNPHLCAARSGGAGRQPVLAGRGADAENHPDQKRARSGRAPLADRAGRCRYRAQHGGRPDGGLKG